MPKNPYRKIHLTIYGFEVALELVKNGKREKNHETHDLIEKLTRFVKSQELQKLKDELPAVADVEDKEAKSIKKSYAKKLRDLWSKNQMTKDDMTRLRKLAEDSSSLIKEGVENFITFIELDAPKLEEKPKDDSKQQQEQQEKKIEHKPEINNEQQEIKNENPPEIINGEEEEIVPPANTNFEASQIKLHLNQTMINEMESSLEQNPTADEAYKEFTESLKKLKEKTDKYYNPEENGDFRKLNKEDLDELLEFYNDAAKNADKVIKGGAEDTNAKRLQEIAEAVKPLLDADLAALETAAELN